MIIDQLSSQDEKLWNDYILEHPAATFYHQLKWKTLIESTYSRHFKPLYLIAKDQGSVKGVLPIYYYKHPIFGKKLISLAFASHGGPCADNDDISDRLIQEAIRLTKNLNADFYELRDSKKLQGEFTIIEDYCTQVLPVTDELNVIYSQFSTNIKRNLKKTQKLDIRTEFNSNDFDVFYRIFSLGQRNLGTPIQKASWVKNLYTNFKDQHELVISYYKDKPVSVQMIRKFRGSIFGIFGYALPEYRHLNVNHLLHWDLIQYAYNNGYQFYDFGRSRIGGGVYQFKRKWGAQDVPLFNHYYMHRAKKSFDTGQANPARGKFAKIWKRMPLPLANYLGPFIRSNYP